MDWEATLQSWISQARQMLAREEDYPLISSREINMDDALFRAWPERSEQRSVLESAYARDPQDTAVRFVALNFLYRLTRYWQGSETEALYEDECDAVHEDLKLFVRLAEPDGLEDLRTIRWEIVNACAIKDYERVGRLYDRIEHLRPLSDAEVHALRGQFHFLVVFLPRWELQDELSMWVQRVDGTFGARDFRAVLIALEAHQIQGTAALSPEDIDHLRDACSQLEKALSRNPDLSPAYRFMLTRAYFAKGDFHNAAAQCEWLLQRLPGSVPEFVRSLDAKIYEAVIMSLHRALVEACDSAGETDRAIEASERLIRVYPNAPGTYARLARLHLKKTADYEAAYRCLLKECERNPSFGEDPNVSLALAFGEIAGPDRFSKALSTYRSSNPAEFALVRSLVLNHWPDFAKLSEESQTDWVNGNWSLFTQAFGEGAQQPPARHASYCFGLALERELVARVFRPFSKAVPEDLDVDQL